MRSRLARVLPIAAIFVAGARFAVHATDLERAKGLYASRCAFCHGSAGKGDGPAGAALKPPPTNFADSAYWKTASSDSVKSAIENGKPATAMMPFKAALRADEIDDLVVYIRTFTPQP